MYKMTCAEFLCKKIPEFQILELEFQFDDYLTAGFQNLFPTGIPGI
jgi:hypothetical protein